MRHVPHPAGMAQVAMPTKERGSRRKAYSMGGYNPSPMPLLQATPWACWPRGHRPTL